MVWNLSAILDCFDIFTELFLLMNLENMNFCSVDFLSIRCDIQKLPCGGIRGHFKNVSQVELSDLDRDLHRFLWRPISDKPLQEARMTRLTFGFITVSCNPSFKTGSHWSPVRIPGSLNRRSRRFLRRWLLNRSRIRGWSYSAPCRTEHFAELCWNDTSQMEIQFWASSQFYSRNSRETESTQPLPLPQGFQKRLEIHWNNTHEDTFYVAIPTVNDANDVSSTTKKSIASQAVQVFDLLGFHSPSVLFVKCRNSGSLSSAGMTPFLRPSFVTSRGGGMTFIYFQHTLSVVVVFKLESQFFSWNYMNSVMHQKQHMEK